MGWWLYILCMFAMLDHFHHKLIQRPFIITSSFRDHFHQPFPSSQAALPSSQAHLETIFITSSFTLTIKIHEHIFITSSFTLTIKKHVHYWGVQYKFMNTCFYEHMHYRGIQCKIMNTCIYRGVQCKFINTCITKGFNANLWTHAFTEGFNANLWTHALPRGSMQISINGSCMPSHSKMQVATLTKRYLPSWCSYCSLMRRNKKACTSSQLRVTASRAC